MKFSEYQAVKTLTADNIFLVDGDAGTKKITAADAVLASLALNSVHNRRAAIRGKNLGTSVSLEQKTAIQLGTFDDLWVGDYWVINGITWRIVDFDYWFGTGDTAMVKHHAVIMPDDKLATGKMNGTNTTAGGYIGSQMYTATLPTVKTTVSGAFSDMLLMHREYLINAVSGGVPTAGAWTDSFVDLPNEPMIYGSYINAPAGTGTSTPKRYTNSGTQLALFRLAPTFINRTPAGQNVSYWLRDVVSDQRFVRVDEYGPSSDAAASIDYGIRPVFAIG